MDSFAHSIVINKEAQLEFAKYLSKLFNTVVTTEYITFIAAIFLLSKRRVGIWRLFTPFLFLIIFVETIGWYQNWVLKKHANGLIFNFNLIVNVFFSASMILQAEPLQKAKKKLMIVIYIFLLFAVVNLIFFQGLHEYNSATEVFGDVVCLVLSCYFFYAVISEKAYRNLFQYEYFWYANGVMFYSVGAVVLYVSYTYLETLKTAGLVAKVYVTFNNLLNILLYGSYIIAFICRNRNTKS